MLRNFCILSMLASMTLSLGCSRDVPAPSGAQMYVRYCASCHGTTGKGDGPAALSLQKMPSDLTVIAKYSKGQFDRQAIIEIIDGRKQITAHGSRVMPVWGAVFTEELQEKNYPEYTILLRSGALADYLQSIQEK